MCCKILTYKCSGVCADRTIFSPCGTNLVKKTVITGHLYIDSGALETTTTKYIRKNSITLPVLSIIRDYKEATLRINNIFTEASEEFPFRTSADTFRKAQNYTIVNCWEC